MQIEAEAGVVPPRASCKSARDCRLHSSYCGSCSCLALAPGQVAPKCQDPVRCFVDPCLEQEPICKKGQCVAVTQGR